MIRDAYIQLLRELGFERIALRQTLKHANLDFPPVYFNCNREGMVYFTAYARDREKFIEDRWDFLPPQQEKDKKPNLITVVPEPGLERDAFESLLKRAKPRAGITSITIRNFKGIGDTPVTIPIRPITLLFGANSAGKSTIFQAFHYLRELLERRNPDPDFTLGGGNSYDLGGFRQIVHKHDLSREIVLRADFQPDEDGLPLYYPVPPDEAAAAKATSPTTTLNVNSLGDIGTLYVEVKVRWDQAASTPVIAEYNTGVNGREIARINLAAKRSVLPRPVLDVFELEHPVFESWPPEVREGLGAAYEFSREDVWWGMALRAQTSVVPALDRGLADDEDMEGSEGYTTLWSIISQFTVGAGALVLRELKQMRYIGPIRAVPERSHQPMRVPNDADWADGLGAWDLMQAKWIESANESLRCRANEYLRHPDCLDLGYEVIAQEMIRVSTQAPEWLDYLEALKRDMAQETVAPVVPGRGAYARLPREGRLVLRDLRNQTEVSPQDIGIGVSQVLPVIVGAIDTGKRILIVEQPELHLHPKAQCGLGDVFASELRRNEDKVFILETHSEHLILRCLRRIRETAAQELPEGKPALHPHEVGVLYFEATADGVSVTELPVDETGEFTRPWPQGFFEERFDELFGEA